MKHAISIHQRETKEGKVMKRTLGLIAVAGGVLLLAGAATAHWEGNYGPGRWGGMGHGMGGPGWASEGLECPGWTQTANPVTEEKAKELAQNYADQYLPGYKVERVLPFTGMHHTMYSVELKNTKGELRTFHINPFGYIMPFSGPRGHGS
jgi:hypothetical protein